MQTITEVALERAVRGVFTRREAACWINSGGGARLDALLKRAVAHGEVLRIVRGIYCMADRYSRRRINPFELAQRIRGPSYVSLESALSHHGWIPEAVQAITSASLERSRTFETPIGLFSFTCVPQSHLYTEVSRIEEDSGGAFLLASPLKALADYVYAHRRRWVSLAPVLEDLRVDENAMADLKAESFDALMNHYRTDRVTRFLTGLRKDLRL
jgi:hypothetical protein